MPPIYEFSCELCDAQVWVTRKMGDNEPPKRIELNDDIALCELDDSRTHRWRRILSRTHVDRGPNWNYRKPT